MIITNNMEYKPSFFKAIIGFSLIFLSNASLSQVALRDTVVQWQHHRFELNDDHSMKSFTTIDTDIQNIQFTGAKVIENDLIRLVIIPEYGARVLSFYYKPTNHEYLYQSEIGSPYGIGDGNFYYDWLMVYGGIFPTFPEPEHGKTWFLPWDYSVVKNNTDTITIRMEYQDSTNYAGAPGGFNNGITNITCRVDISVYSNSTIWDYEVTLINNKPNNVNYEYWTCTTLAPGSETGNTGSPLNSEIVVPVDEYVAGWSPGSWIGSYNTRHKMTDIDYLHKWDDMGIAYGYNLDETYWGVINHDNEEGIFRISENIETKGMKLWTWGKNNVDNNLYDFSNGGADNYIELWAGVSNAFFEDAILAPNQTKNWTESYCASVGLSSIININNEAAVNLLWQESDLNLRYELNTFITDRVYNMQLYIDGENFIEVAERTIAFAPLGTAESISLTDLNLSVGEHLVRLDLYDESDQLILEASKLIDVSTVLATSILNPKSMSVKLNSLGNYSIELFLPNNDEYLLKVLNLNGSIILEDRFNGPTNRVKLPGSGLYIFNITGRKSAFSGKIFIR